MTPTAVFLTIMIASAFWGAVSAVRIVAALKAREQKASVLWARLFMPLYLHRYAETTRSETGKAGPLFYHYVISFNLADIHPHDVATILDEQGVAVRAGHHCTRPLHRILEIPATTRASFYVYNTDDDVDRLVTALGEARRLFGVA